MMPDSLPTMDSFIPLLTARGRSLASGGCKKRHDAGLTSDDGFLHSAAYRTGRSLASDGCKKRHDAGLTSDDGFLHSVAYRTGRNLASGCFKKRDMRIACPPSKQNYFFILACSAAISAARLSWRFSRPSPRSKRTKRTTSALPPSILVTLMSGSLTKGCSRRQTSL